MRLRDRLHTAMQAFHEAPGLLIPKQENQLAGQEQQTVQNGPATMAM